MTDPHASPEGTSTGSDWFAEMSKKDEYDWLDDPFNDKKASADREGMGSGAKLALGCGCLVVVVALVVLVLFVGLNALDILGGR